MLWSLTFESMRQEHYQSAHAQPFNFTSGDEFVNYYLGAIGEVAELGLPHDQHVWIAE